MVNFWTSLSFFDQSLFYEFPRTRSWLQNSSLLGNCKKTTFQLSCLSFLLYAHIKEELGSWQEGETCLINWYRKLLQATTWIACPICSSLERSDLNHWWDLIELHESLLLWWSLSSREFSSRLATHRSTTALWIEFHKFFIKPFLYQNQL